MQDRAAACGHGMDQHHRCTHANASHFRLKGALIFAVKMRHIRRGAAHVEANDIGKARLLAGLGKANHAAGGARQDRVLALEHIGRRQTARRHHEHDARAGTLNIELIADLADIATQHRREIGVDDGGIAATDELDQRRDLMADRDLLEADGSRDFSDRSLMSRKLVSMHEDDRDRAIALGEEITQRHFCGLLVQNKLDGAVGKHALSDLDDLFIKRFRLDDLGREDLLAFLIADAQRVAETLRRHQGKTFALALEQCIGSDRRAHADLADRPLGNRLALAEAKMEPNAVHGRVTVSLGVLRKNLAGMESARWIAPDNIGKGTAAIDPEIPTTRNVLRQTRLQQHDANNDDNISINRQRFVVNPNWIGYPAN